MDSQQQTGVLPEKMVCPSLVASAMSKNMDQDVLPHRNLGSFICTSHSDIVTELTSANFFKNQACVEEYGSISEYRERCISILAHLWNKKDHESPVGAATTGSSEAIMLAGLAMRRAWEQKGSDAGRPNIIIGSNAHACVFKFASYFDVEARIVPVNITTGFMIDVQRVMGMLDKDTVGVILTLGSTYTGHYDPVQEVAQALETFEKNSGHFIPIHIDAASGGFVAPFDPACKGLLWDFRLRHVQSINASGHKFGFSACAVGWLVWRDVSCVPESLMVESTYLRGKQTSYSLSFSRSNAPIVVQYFNFLSLGDEGYKQRISSLLSSAEDMTHQLNRSRYFECLSPGHQPLRHKHREGEVISHCQNVDSTCDVVGKNTVPGLPVVVFTLSKLFRARHPHVSLNDLCNWVYERGYSIPHYALPSWGWKGEDIDVMRIVFREDIVPQLPTVLDLLKEGIQVLCRE